MKTKVEYQEPLVREMNALTERHLEEVKDHQKLHAEIAVLKRQVIGDGMTASYDQLKDLFLTYLSLYIDELRTKNREVNQITE